VDTRLPHNLIDEYRFMIYPLVLGGGKRFFNDDNDKATLSVNEPSPRLRASRCTSANGLPELPRPRRTAVGATRAGARR
jgi:dihydrofolate reductase